jgi:enoyl-CoA hydratase
VLYAVLFPAVAGLYYVQTGTSREAAEALARELAAFPQAAMRADRLSVYDGSLEREFERGSRLLDEAKRGADRFAGGEGRHGDF